MKLLRRYLVSLTVEIEVPDKAAQVALTELVPLDGIVAMALENSTAAEAIATGISEAEALDSALSVFAEAECVDVDVSVSLLGQAGYTIDGEPVDLMGFLAANCALDEDFVRDMLALQPGQSKLIGGGPASVVELRCEPFGLIYNKRVGEFCDDCGAPTTPDDSRWRWKSTLVHYCEEE